jgi:outer membrane lipoprotein
MMNQYIRLTLNVASVLLVSACVSVPVQFEGEYPELMPDQVTPAEVRQKIRWGGVIIDTRVEANRTCFEMLSRQLQKSMRPEHEDQSNGRFIACKDGFHDPEVFTKGRELSITGVIEGIDVGKVDEFEYRYPIVKADFIVLWAKRPNVVIRNYGHYGPYYWHHPFYPYYRYPFYY